MIPSTQSQSVATAGFHPELLSSLGIEKSRLVTDSRTIKPGDTFVAYPGSRTDGRQFITQAIASGANAVIWEAHDFAWDHAWQLPNLAVTNLRHHAGEIAAHVYGHPSKKLWTVGVTGTNGKTSCAHWIAQSFGGLGKKTALIGTLGNGFAGTLQPTLNTTPDAIRLHGLLADYLAEGAQAVAMEVSSHALEQGRVNGMQYDIALLTNLSRDHLDYHGDMRSYAAAKRRLFDWPNLKYAVLNFDDAFGIELAELLQGREVEVVGYGLSDNAQVLAERFKCRMVAGSELRLNAQGFSVQVHSGWGSGELHGSLLGRFNAANLLGVLTVLLLSGVPLNEALRELAQAKAVAGRMQSLGGGKQPTVVVDYAHTPDALEKVLQSLQELVAAGKGKLICVFGCGGDRDSGKRPMMGAVASTLADMCIVTSDNPRGENPHNIIAAITSGMVRHNYQIMEDRGAAITQAISNAHVADMVLVAGKGHEDYQEVQGVKSPFSDIAVAQHALQVWCSPERFQEIRGGKA